MRRRKADSSDVFNRIEALLAEGMDAEAARLLDEALRRDPDNASLCLRAAVSIVLADLPKATVLAKRAVSLAPRDPAIMLRSAWFLFAAGELEEASALADRVRASAPPDWIFANDLVHLRGRLAAVGEENDIAERLLRQAFEEEPARMHHAAAYSEILLIRGDYPGALKILAAGLQHFPDDEWLHRLRCDVMARFRAEY
jgi:predicted Zn-dependent protease